MASKNKRATLTTLPNETQQLIYQFAMTKPGLGDRLRNRVDCITATRLLQVSKLVHANMLEAICLYAGVDSKKPQMWTLKEVWDAEQKVFLALLRQEMFNSMNGIDGLTRR